MNITASKGTKSSTTVPGQSGTKPSASIGSASVLLSQGRVNIPRAMVGGLGVVACAMGAVAASHVLDSRTAVLVVTQPVAAGQVITAADVRPVPVALDGGVDAVPASQSARVIGHPAALPLVAGALLGSADIGQAMFPPVGQAVVAVGLKAGMYPMHLAAGDRVQVVLPAPSGTPTMTQPSGASGAAVKLTATVTAVGKPDPQGVMVANLLMDADGAAKVAAASTSMSGIAVTVLPAGDS